MTLAQSKRSGEFHKCGFINDTKKGTSADAMQHIGAEEFMVPSVTTSGKVYKLEYWLF